MNLLCTFDILKKYSNSYLVHHIINLFNILIACLPQCITTQYLVTHLVVRNVHFEEVRYINYIM